MIRVGERYRVNGRIVRVWSLHGMPAFVHCEVCNDDGTVRQWVEAGETYGITVIYPPDRLTEPVPKGEVWT